MIAARFRRVANYGESTFVGPCEGPLWRHPCGRILDNDLLLDHGSHASRPTPEQCDKCGSGKPWLPMFVYTGPLCDQCNGNGWVPIGGQHPGFMAFETVTECTACNASGVAL